MSKIISIKIKQPNEIKAPSRKELEEIEKEMPSETDQVYLDSFFNIVMNNTNQIPSDQYRIVINSICPILSLKFLEVKRENVKKVIENYLNIRPEEKEVILSLDEASRIDHIFRFYLNQYQLDKNRNGFESALDEHQDFYFLAEELYLQIPISFILAMVDNLERNK